MRHLARARRAGRTAARAGLLLQRAARRRDRRPIAATATIRRDSARRCAATRSHFLNHEIGHLWPKAVAPAGSSAGTLLVDPPSRSGGDAAADEARFETQFWTANVNPVGPLHALSLPGSPRVPDLAARQHLRQPDDRRRLDRLRVQRGLRRGGRHVGSARRPRARPLAAARGHRRLRPSVRTQERRHERSRTSTPTGCGPHQPVRNWSTLGRPAGAGAAGERHAPSENGGGAARATQLERRRVARQSSSATR